MNIDNYRSPQCINHESKLMKEKYRNSKLPEYTLKTLAQLFPKANRLLLAVSGGGDSVALLHSLTGSNYSISVAHFDHALRKDSSKDATFVKGLCKNMGVAYYSARVEVAQIAKKQGWNLEDAARRLRYEFLTRIAKNISVDAIVTAHTLDDQVETVLMQLLRGAAFLKGMKARQGSLLRPLLKLPKQNLLSYLHNLGQNYRSDKTNFDTSYTRAWLRHEILPKLEARYPNIKITLAHLAELQQSQSEHFDKLIINKKKLEVKQLEPADIAVQRHNIAHLIKSAGISSDFEHIEMIRNSLDYKHPTKISLPKRKLARIRYGNLDIVNAAENAAKTLESNFRVEVEQDLSIQVSQGLSYNLDFEQEVDFSRLVDFPDLKLRYRQTGDRIKLAGGTRKITDLFIDKKIPKEDRNSIPLLASQSEVLWVQGIATDVRVARANQDNDIQWMKIALKEAKIASQFGELPVGAVLVKEGKLIAKAANITESEHDPTAHAEVVVLRLAAKSLQSWRLDGCTLYSTLEPCPMCFGAILQAHLPRLVYGAINHREGALGGVGNLQEFNWKHTIKVRSGVLASSSRKLLSGFFKELR